MFPSIKKARKRQAMAAIAHKPNDELRTKVETYAAVGIPSDDIAKVLGITGKTLRKYYRLELDLGAIKANAKVGGKLYDQCMDGNTTAMIFWLKTRARWSENAPQEEHDNPKPVKIEIVDMRKDAG